MEYLSIDNHDALGFKSPCVILLEAEQIAARRQSFHGQRNIGLDIDGPDMIAINRMNA